MPKEKERNIIEKNRSSNIWCFVLLRCKTHKKNSLMGGRNRQKKWVYLYSWPGMPTICLRICNLYRSKSSQLLKPQPLLRQLFHVVFLSPSLQVWLLLCTFHDILLLKCWEILCLIHASSAPSRHCISPTNFPFYSTSCPM